MKINLGDRVQDIVTGLQGIVTAEINYITGCRQFGITPPSEGGKLPDTVYIDDKRLHVMQAAAVMIGVVNTGGPMSDAPRAQHGPR